MLKVHCISQEYWYMRKRRCLCGGEFEHWMQSLEDREGTTVDVLKTQCKQCGFSKEFVFDISSFHNPFRDYERLGQVEHLLKELYPESEVQMKMASPMEATLMYLRQLKESGDRVALEYIADSVQWAIDKMDEQTA